MRVAALSDIHGNLPALGAVLADLENARVDAIVVAGDSISGPWPAEVFDLLAEVGALVVRGNVDRLALEGGERPIGDWSARRLGDRRATVAAWPLTLELEIDGLGTVLVCHATPTSDEPIYTRVTPDADVLATLGPVTADALVCGHTHMQYDRTLSSGLRLVNPGSVGMPYEGKRGAFWALLGPDVELRCTEYDVDAAVAAIRERRAPGVVEQHIAYLLEPPDATETTEYFESLRAS
ncbi:MAG: metallophosphoesterase family protein [Gaiellaceae bacterium]